MAAVAAGCAAPSPQVEHEPELEPEREPEPEPEPQHGPEPEREPPQPQPEPEPRTALEACNDERDELFCKYLWDGGTELVWAEDERGALVQVERTVVPDITRIVDGTDPASK